MAALSSPSPFCSHCHCDNICELQVTPLGFKLSSTNSFAFLHKTCLFHHYLPSIWTLSKWSTSLLSCKAGKEVRFKGQTIRFYLLRWEPLRVWLLAPGGYCKFQFSENDKIAPRAATSRHWSLLQWGVNTAHHFMSMF